MANVIRSRIGLVTGSMHRIEKHSTWSAPRYGVHRRLNTNPWLLARSIALSELITRMSFRSTLLPHRTMSGVSQYEYVCSWLNQLCTLTNDCSLVTSNSNKKPMASRKKAFVRLRNLRHTHSRLCIVITSGFLLFAADQTRFESTRHTDPLYTFLSFQRSNLIGIIYETWTTGLHHLLIELCFIICFTWPVTHCWKFPFNTFPKFHYTCEWVCDLCTRYKSNAIHSYLQIRLAKEKNVGTVTNHIKSHEKIMLPLRLTNKKRARKLSTHFCRC